MASTEAFLFGIDKIVTDINQNKSTLSLLTRQACEDLLKVNTDTLRDAQLLLGTSYTPTFPVLEGMAAGKPVTIVDAINLLNSVNKSVIQLCSFHRDHPQVQALNYSTRYKKAIMTIRHHVVLEKTGVVAPLNFDTAPGDVHEFVGQRLPEELFFYISRGILGSQIPNWLTSGEIVLSLPGGVLDSEPYRRLVIESLNPLRTEALKILAESLHYYYQSRVVKVDPWVPQDTSSLTIEIRNTSPLKMKLAPWKVRGSDVESIFGDSEVRCPTHRHRDPQLTKVAQLPISIVPAGSQGAILCREDHWPCQSAASRTAYNRRNISKHHFSISSYSRLCR